jgi:hypothetical protein
MFTPPLPISLSAAGVPRELECKQRIFADVLASSSIALGKNYRRRAKLLASLGEPSLIAQRVCKLDQKWTEVNMASQKVAAVDSASIISNVKDRY